MPVAVEVSDDPGDWRDFAAEQLRGYGFPVENVMLIAGPSARNPHANHRMEFMHISNAQA